MWLCRDATTTDGKSCIKREFLQRALFFVAYCHGRKSAGLGGNPSTKFYISTNKICTVIKIDYLSRIMKPLRLKTPVHYRLALAFNLAVFACAMSYGQTLEDFKTEQLQKNDSIIVSLQDSKRLQFLTLTPSVSYNFETGVSVGFSLSNFTNYIQQKRRNKIETAKLKIQMDENLNQELNSAEEERLRIFNLREEVFVDVSVLEHRKELHEIAYLSHVNKELTYSDYTIRRIAYIEKHAMTVMKIRALELLTLKYKNKYNVELFNVQELIETAKNYELKD